MANEEHYDDFNPASSNDDVIYLGKRKYVRADMSNDLLEALEEISKSHDGLGSWKGACQHRQLIARAAIAKATENNGE